MTKYIGKLLNQDRQLFHTQDLRVLWGIYDNNMLYKTIQRYKQKGLLYPVYKGLYATNPIAAMDQFALGLIALHGYGYVSCESILAQQGLINRIPEVITLVSHFARQFQIGDTHFSVRQIHDRFLYHPYGIVVEQGVRVATVERALADLLYLQPLASLDAPVDWDKIRVVQKKIGYPITKRT